VLEYAASSPLSVCADEGLDDGAASERIAFDDVVTHRHARGVDDVVVSRRRDAVGVAPRVALRPLSDAG
jgi:hypothetical protein